MAFSLYIDESCVTTSCTYVEYTGGYLQWNDRDGGGDYVGVIYRNNDDHEFTYSGPDDLYLTTTYFPGSGGGGGGGNTPGGGTTTNTPWSTTIEYYIDGTKTTFFQDVHSVESYPTSITDLQNLIVSKYGTTGVIIEYKKSGSSTTEDYIITTKPGLKYSSISVSVGTEYSYSNKPSVIKIYFTKDSSVEYTVSVSASPSAGGIVTISPNESTYNYSDKVTITATARTGYTFKGWSISNLSGGSTTSNSYTFYVLNNHTCIASFTANSYTITYKDRGNVTFSGTHASGYPKIHTYGTPTSLKSPTKRGYTFGGWYTTSDCTGTALTSLSATGYTSNITLYAKWTANKYQITYYDQGGTTFSGTHASGYPQTHTYGVSTTLKYPTKTGYTFGGWYTTSDCSGSAVSSLGATAYTSDITLYAKWTAKTVTITWNPNGGSVSPTTSSYTYDGTAVTLPTPTRTGYTFNGWYTAASGGTRITNIGSSIKPTSNVTYYAHWTAKTVTITWNPNGGSVSPTTSSYTYDGTAVTLPTPTRTGYTFNGWYTSASGGSKINGIGGSNTKPTINVTYYAHWTANTYTITYKDKGGSTFSGVNLGALPSKHTYGTDTTLISGSKTGYTFGGWYTTSDCSGSVVSSLGATAYTSNITLYTKWTAKTVTITWNAAGGTVSPTSSSYTYDGTAVTLPTPTRTGYTFNGWYTSASGGSKINGIGGSNTKPVADVTYYAHWTINTYSLTWNANGGTIPSSPAYTSGSVNYGTSITKPGNPTRTGYSFTGWKDQNGSGTVATTMPAKDLTYTAQWYLNTYTITYNTGGGTIPSTSSAPTTYTVETATISLPTPTRSGYTFKGWYGNNQYSGSQITQIPKGSTGNKQFWAKWEGNACTITVNANPSDLTGRLSGGGNYKNGDSITITAPLEYGVYKFESWTKNGSFVSSEPQYTFTANGSATYVANFIDNRKTAVFRISVLDGSYVETSLCEVEIKYGDLDNPSENSIKRAGNREIEIDGPSSICNVIKTHISGTNILDKFSGSASSGVYIFPESINNEPFINILYNGNPAESVYTNDTLTFDVYYGKMPKPSTGGGGSNPGGGTDTETDNKELTVRFKYYLDGTEIDTSNGAYISWPASNIDELKCYWFKYDYIQENDREAAISGSTDRINFTYIPEYYGDPANSTPISNLKNSLELEAPMLTHLASPTFLSGVDIHNTNDTYTYANCSNNILDICVYFESYEFNAYAYSNLPAYGDAYIGRKGVKQAPFYASSVNPTTLVFNAEVLNNAFYFNRWVDYNTKSGLSTNNPWIIYRPKGQDYHVEAEFLGRQINVKLNPLNGKLEAFWQRVGIVGGTNRFKTISFDLDEDIKYPDDNSGYEFLGWYTSVSNGNGSGDLIIDTDGNLQSNVPGWTTSDGLWIKGPDDVSPGLIADVVVYAKWKPIEYTITYKNLKGAVNPSANPSKYTIETPTITFVKPTENLPRGYTWLYWSPSTVNNGSIHNRTITACWSTNKYTLTWDLNGGTVTKAGTCAPLDATGIASGQVEYLSSITAPVVYKNGYNFLGWSANGVDVITPTSSMPDGDVKYIAVYSKKTYQITVNDDPALDKVHIKVNGVNKGTTTTCTTEDEITLVAENTLEYVLNYWKKSGGSSVLSAKNEFTFIANDTYLDNSINNIFTAYYVDDPNATLKINFIVDGYPEKTAIFKFATTFSFIGKENTGEYMFKIQGDPKCIEGNIDINQQGFFFIPNKYNGKDICNVAGTEMICSNKGNTIGYDGYNSQYYKDNTAQNRYCPIGFEWQAYLPTNNVDETHLVFPAVEKEKYGILYGPLVIDIYYGEIPERFVPDNIEISQVSGLTLLQRIQNKISTFKWLNNLFGEPEKTTWGSYYDCGLKSFLKDDSKETPLSMHCIEYGDLATSTANTNPDKTIKQYSLTLDNIIKPLSGQVVLNVSKIEGNKIYFNISNSNGFTNTSDGIYIYFSVNNETNENSASLYKVKLPKSASSKGLLLTIPGVSNIESLYIYRAPIMVDSTKVGIIPKIYFNYGDGIDVYDRTTLNVVI